MEEYLTLRNKVTHDVSKLGGLIIQEAEKVETYLVYKKCCLGLEDLAAKVPSFIRDRKELQEMFAKDMQMKRNIVVDLLYPSSNSLNYCALGERDEIVQALLTVFKVEPFIDEQVLELHLLQLTKTSNNLGKT